MRTQQITDLARKHGASLVLFARQWTHDPDDALQEAFVDLINLKQPPLDATAWLFTTVKRKAMNRERSEARRKKHTAALAEHYEPWFVPSTSALDLEEVTTQLKQLPDLEREIIVARIWGQLRFDQIAQLVDRSRSSVHRSYQSALATLASGLTGSLKSQQHSKALP